MNGHKRRQLASLALLVVYRTLLCKISSAEEQDRFQFNAVVHSKNEVAKEGASYKVTTIEDSSTSRPANADHTLSGVGTKYMQQTSYNAISFYAQATKFSAKETPTDAKELVSHSTETVSRNKNQHDFHSNSESTEALTVNFPNSDSSSEKNVLLLSNTKSGTAGTHENVSHSGDFQSRDFPGTKQTTWQKIWDTDSLSKTGLSASKHRAVTKSTLQIDPQTNLSRLDEDDYEAVPFSAFSQANLLSEPLDRGNCKLDVSNKSIDKFRHIVYYKEAIFVYLNLVPGKGVNISGNESVVNENIWVWTFAGKEGGLETLNWPVEYGIWSMGLLLSYVIHKPLPMEIEKVSGNCSALEVGDRESDLVITEALTLLAKTMMNLNKEMYGPSFFCYNVRKYIKKYFVYVLCKHIVCPLETLRYSCCSYFFNTSLHTRVADCSRDTNFDYEPLTWTFPIIISMILFAFFPLFLMYMAHLIFDKNHPNKENNLHHLADGGHAEVDLRESGLVLLNEYQYVTLTKTIFLPLKIYLIRLYFNFPEPCQIVMSRVWRIIIPFLTLLFVLLQVCLDYYFLRNFVLTSILRGVPMGFRSVLAGYKESRRNFLPYLGGPFVAVGIYLFLTCLLLIIPKSISGLLTSGLRNNYTQESFSPLCLRLRCIEKYGSVKIRHRHGFLKLYSVLLAQFFMLINIEFWKHILQNQKERWTKTFWNKRCMVVLPLYVIFCFIEIVTSLCLYGLPIVSFGLIIVKAYSGKLKSRQYILLPFKLVLFLITVVCVVFFLFMFCIIFMDAILFISRVGMFTFTGIVIYPKESYGYLIFAFTVFYYMWQSVQEYSLVYHRLLKYVILTGESLQRTNDDERMVVQVGDFKGIKKSLFEFVIETHCPRRKQVLVSILKVVVILTIIGILINILYTTNNFLELHVIMHVGTALFVCAMPQVMRNMCRGTGEKYRQKRFRRELAETITTFMGYCNEFSESCFSDSD